MFKPVSLFVGLRYSRAAKGNAFISFISFFSIAGIALGLMSLIIVSSVMNGFEHSLKTAMLDLIPHVKVKHEEGQDKPELINSLSASSHVKSVTPYLTSDVILQTSKELVGVKLQGQFSGYDSALLPYLETGNLERLEKQKYQLALSRYLANKLDVSIGQKVRVILPDVSTYTPMGRMPAQRLFTVAAIYNGQSEADTYLAFADGKSLMRMLRKPKGTYDLNIKLHDAFHSDEYRHAQQMLLAQYEIEDWKSQQGALFSAVAMEKRVMSLLLGLIVIVAIFNILSALSMMVREKQAEVAILQTLGFTPAMIAQVFMVQGAYNGIVGTLIGSVVGILLALNINEVLNTLGLALLGGMTLPVKFEPWGLAAMIISSILLSFLATFLPAKKAASVLPAEVLRYE